jgi:diacylglycerol kinase family enzyme
MIAVVVNPNAHGVRRRAGLTDRLRRRLGSRGDLVETRGAEDLHRAAERFAARGVDLVATCGGDGTNLSTFTELVRAYGEERVPRVALLRGGTVNTIAQNLKVHGDPETLLDRLCQRLDAGGALPMVTQDLLRVNDMYGCLFASAMGARFLEAYYRGPVLGPAWAGLLAARTVGSSLVGGRFARWLFQPVPLALTIEGEVATAVTGARLLLASTVRDVGIGMKVTWQAGRAPKRFHLVASGLSTPRMALQLHRVVAGRPLTGRPHLDRLATSAEVRFTEPQSFTLDGELFSAREISLRSGPRLCVVTP